MTFPDASFDVVMLNDMLAYTDRGSVLKETARVLRPGGVAISLHNNSIGWSWYKMHYPEKSIAVEWGHSIVVIANTILENLTAKRAFRTTFNSRQNLHRAIQKSGLVLDEFWETSASYRWYHFVLSKPQTTSDSAS